MLHISKDEQAERLLERLDDPTKHWKYNPADVDERAAGTTTRRRTRTCCAVLDGAAPWFVVPANRKWHRDWLLVAPARETLESIPVSWPDATFDPDVEKARIRRS